MNIEKAVIDSSVLVALLTPEKYSKWADKMLSNIDKWISLDLIYYEMANAIWKKYMRLNSLKREDAYEALDKALEILGTLFQIYSCNEIIEDAFKKAEELNITVYDAGYIVLAKKLGVKLVTLDGKLRKRLEGTEDSRIIIAPE